MAPPSMLLHEVLKSVSVKFVIVFMITTLLILMIVDVQVVQAISTNNGDTGVYRSNLPTSGTYAPSTSSTSSTTPTIQAPLQIPRTLQSNDLVNSLAFYEVTFITSTTGAIDKIRMDFPAGTNIAAAGVIEKVGIGGGTLLKSGSSITYDVTTPVIIPAGTFIRLEIFGIKNPSITSTSFMATITTRDSEGNLIDGPSTTNVYTIKQIGSNDIADSSLTSSKPAESFMKRVTLEDDAAGNALGWNPPGSSFAITEPALVSGTSSYVSAFVEHVSSPPNVCVVQTIMGEPVPPPPNTFVLGCTGGATEGDKLHYVVVNLPPHIP